MNRQPLAIRLETRNHIIRTVERSDATESWAKWLLNPTAARQLNAKPQAITLDALTAYIDRFDRVNGHLLGMFEKETGRIVGIRSIYVNFATKEFHINVLIGEVDVRGTRARAETADVVYAYFFETLGFEAAVCNVLADNKQGLGMVARLGFVPVRSDLKPSTVDGRLIEIRLFRLTREARRRKLREQAQAQQNA